MEGGQPERILWESLPAFIDSTSSLSRRQTPDKIRLIAKAGRGTFQYVADENRITGAIVKALQAH